MNIIEKLEKLCAEYGDHCEYFGHEVKDDLRAIIEEYKATEQEPIGYMSQASLTNLINGNDVIVGKQSELRDVSVFTHPQPSDETVKDAERYRWLRDEKNDVALVLDKQTDWVPPDDAVSGVGGYWRYEYRAGEQLDSAIDEAMKDKS